MQILSCSIDLSKIDKNRIIEGKNGAKYYNLTVIQNDEPNKIGKDIDICTQQTKIERENKEKRVYIGGGKTVFKSPKTEANEQNSVSSHGTTTRDGITTKDDDGLPF